MKKKKHYKLICIPMLVMVSLVCCHLTRTNPPKHANWVIFASAIILDCEYVILKRNMNHGDDVQLLLK